MANETLIKKILSISPFVEVMVRVFYYKNIKFLKKYSYLYRVHPYNKNKSINKKSKKKIDLKYIISFLGDKYIKNGDLVVLHCSYKEILSSGFTPDEVIDLLIELIGKKGTLAMSARPDFDIDLNKYMSQEEDDNVYFYDVENTKCNTGIISQRLIEREDSIRSEHPINSMVAIGPLAHIIMKGNIEDENSLPHGKFSSWQRCVENNAKVVAIGVDLTQTATITKTVEDVYNDEWPVKDWYIRKKYKIKNKNRIRSYNLRERSSKWTLHYAERTMCKDFLKNKILHTYNFNGLRVEIAESKDMIKFIKDKMKKSYPYYFTNFNLLKFIKR
tara:strand:- start:79 stop:1068 length:990 start_codon:yes stop_codon:yes gene_type:complete